MRYIVEPPQAAYGCAAAAAERWSHKKMKKSIIMATVGCILAVACTASADQPIYAADYSFVTYSPSSGTYGVQAVLDTTISNWSVRTRFHVFDAPSGDLLWQADTNYGWSGQVHLAPDPNYVVCVNTYFSTADLRRHKGVTGIVTETKEEGKTVLSVNTNLSEKAQQDWLKDTWAVRIYRREKLLRSYSLKDLDIPLVFLRFSVSHANFAETSSQCVPKWRNDPFDSVFEPGPNPRFADNRVLLECSDGMTRVFNLKTGTLIETKKTEGLQQSPAGDVLKAAPEK